MLEPYELADTLLSYEGAYKQALSATRTAKKKKRLAAALDMFCGHLKKVAEAKTL